MFLARTPGAAETATKSPAPREPLPNGYQETPAPVVGTNLRGKPVVLGYHEFVFTWTILKQEAMGGLAADSRHQLSRYSFTTWVAATAW